MFWERTHRFDQTARKIADTHYNRQKVGSAQFCPPGSPIILLGKSALWVTLKQKFQDHEWKGAWVNTLFKNESGELSSDLILDAVAATRAFWGVNPEGLITFIDTKKVKWKKDFGYCYKKAGFVEVGYTKKKNLLVLKLFPNKFPPSELPKNYQMDLFN